MKKLICIISLGFFTSTLPAQDIKYISGNDSWNADSLGNHRAIVVYNGNGKLARVVIPWRRHDNEPQEKRIIVQDAKTGSKITNVKTRIINNETGELLFEPVSGKGSYYVYYMPYKNEGRSNYPKGVYLKAENTAAESWLQSLQADIPVNTFVQEIQAINDFNSFYPMELIATAAEVSALVDKNAGSNFLVFPEERNFPIKMRNYIPYRWIQKGMSTSFTGKANPGEYFTFQMGIYALQDLQDLNITFSDLRGSRSALVPGEKLTCFNTGGIDYTGAPFSKQVSVPKQQVQPMWCGIDVPQNTAPGEYKGKAFIAVKGGSPKTIDIILTVSNRSSPDGGTSEPREQSRLKWLNSTLAQDNKVIAPYTPLKVNGNTISLLGRELELNNDGFPKQIRTFFTKEMTGYKQQPNNILAAPLHFNISEPGGEEMLWRNSGIKYTRKDSGTVQFKAINTSGDLQMEVRATLEFDGFLSYEVKLTALSDFVLKEIAMQIPFTKDASKYMMGLGQKGGYRPDHFNWKWDVASKNQDGAWIGNVQAGLQFSLRDENYVRPLNTNFYLQKPLLLPASWANGKLGGINISEEKDAVVVNNYSGERTLKKGEVLYYNFNLLITPFHTLNTDFQWSTRFYHKYESIDTIRASSATVANIHHATPVNPWLNYPFIEYRKLKTYIDEAHRKGIKVKIYNTVRELSNHAYETFALRSLGHEIYSTGKGGGNPWLQEHVGDDYIAAWYVPELKDAAIVNSGMSRWHNYYVEGMNWLVRHTGIDGIYLDDVAFDRITMKRIKRVLTSEGHPGIIDLHSANQYNRNDGFNNSANLYMEHFPYLSRLWFGEYFDYEKNGPDFFLTEVSGIPFGLMGEMLQNGGNPWRGMIYGMTNRYPWDEHADPRAIWKAWDAFGMQGTSMIGYWSDDCPVKTDHEDVLATVYKKKGAALVAIASWANENTSVQLNIDWAKLGIDPLKATIRAKSIKNFQPAKTFTANEKIPVEKGKGWLLTISN